MRMQPPRIYLAGPAVFRQTRWSDAEAMKQACAARGAVGLFPMDNEIPPQRVPQRTAMLIFEANRAMIDACDAVVADLTPFRGPSADAGTIWELAYAHGRGTAVAGYSLDTTEYKTRAESIALPGEDVEDFGLRDNLMIEGCLASIGIALRNTFEEALEEAIEQLRSR